MVVIICTDEFYSKSGKLASKKQSHCDEKEGEDVEEQTWKCISSFLFDTLDEHLVSSFIMEL